MKRNYVCKKIKLLSYLKSRGFMPINFKRDEKCSTRLVWLFDGSDELYAAVDEYYRERPI